MKKLLIAALCIAGFHTPLSWADDTPAAGGSDVFETLTRTAFRTSQLPTNTAVVTPEEFHQIDAQNAGEAVSNQTSIQTLPVGGLGTALTAGIRGSSSEQTLVLIDGRPYQGFALGSTDLSEIPTESIDHIEIIRGGASALYGPNALGGVINVITKRSTGQASPTADFGFEDGSFGRQAYRGSVGAKTGPVDFFVSGDQQYEAGFRDNSFSRTHNINGNIGFSMGAAGKLILDESSFGAKTGVPGLAYGPSDPFDLSGFAAPLVPSQFNNKDEKLASSPTALQLTDTNSLRLSYLLPLPMNSLMTARVYGVQRNIRFDDSNDPNIFNISDSYRQVQSHGADLQFNLPLGFMVGGSFLHDHETNNDEIDPTNTFHAFVENYGTFVQDEIHVSKLTLIPGVRYDHNSQAGNSTNPRLQAIDDVTDNIRLNASAGHSFTAPTIDDLFYVSQFFVGNPDLRPEKAWTFDGGFELHDESNSFRTTYFYANVTDLIQTVETPSFTFESINVGKARRQGIEVELSDVLTTYVSNDLNYTFLNVRGIPTGFTQYVQLQYSPADTLNDTLTVNIVKDLHADFTGRFESSRNSGNNNGGTEMGSQYLQDIRLVWRNYYFGVSDMFDKRYVEQPGFPLPGRTYFGGINIKLL